MVVAARLGVVAAAVVVINVAALTITATVFDARQWVGFVGSNVLLGMAYALVGVVIGPLFGRVAGVFIAFLVPFLDLGIAQSPMLRLVPRNGPKRCPVMAGPRCSSTPASPRSSTNPGRCSPD